MAFEAGARVTVLSLNRSGSVEAVLRPGVYRVRMGALATTVLESDLGPIAGHTRMRTAGRPAAARGAPVASDIDLVSTIDLHGLTAEEARERVLAHVNDAILAGATRVEIVHGIGTGRLKAVVTEALRGLAAIRRLAPHPTNPGVTIAHL